MGRLSGSLVSPRLSHLRPRRLGARCWKADLGEARPVRPVPAQARPASRSSAGLALPTVARVRAFLQVFPFRLTDAPRCASAPG